MTRIPRMAYLIRLIRGMRGEPTMTSLIRTAPPAVAPVELSDLEAYLRIDPDSEDTLLGQLLDAALGPVEDFLRRQLITASWTRTLDAFPAEEFIELERPPLQSITSFKYVDADGVTQDVDAAIYSADVASDPGRIVLGYGESWPGARGQLDAVTIVYVAGYGDAAADVPERYKLALKYLVSQYYTHRLEPGRIDEGLRNLLGRRNFSFA